MPNIVNVYMGAYIYQYVCEYVCLKDKSWLYEYQKMIWKDWANTEFIIPTNIVIVSKAWYIHEFYAFIPKNSDIVQRLLERNIKETVAVALADIFLHYNKQSQCSLSLSTL